MNNAVLLGIAAIVAGTAIAGCGRDGGTAGASDSGIRGTVLIGPTCAVEVVGGNCADKPYATDLRVVDSGTGDQVATASSSANGHFEVALPAGGYRLAAGSPGSLPRATPVSVTVRPHSYEQVTIRFDSGIR